MAETIITTEYSSEMRKSFINYSMSVITARAVPDVRDGLKPVQRRVLFAMDELGLNADKPHRKSARIVGDAMGKYHPHGDSSIYDALVVLSQDFKKGMALVDGHGNFGSIEGDGAAAMRYTEAKLKKFTQDEETYKKSKYFWIFTPEKNYRYEIISAYTTGVNSDTYTLFKGPGEEFEKYLEKIRGYSEIQTDAEGMNIKDKIITLSTCTGNEATRYVVQGKRVDTLDVGQQNYEEQLPESEENRIAVKADDKNSDDKISVTVF